MPIYTIDSFDRPTSDRPYFIIKRIEDKPKSMQLCSTAHRHNCYFLLFVTQGTGRHIVDEQIYDIHPFSVFFIKPGQVHYYTLSEDAEGFIIHYTLDFFVHYFRERSLPQLPYFKKLYNQNHIRLDPNTSFSLLGLLEYMIYEYIHVAVGREDILRNSLDAFLIHLCRYCDEPDGVSKSDSYSVLIRQLQWLIETHFRQLKLPHEYAQKMNISPKHLNAICKQSTNKTVTELIHGRILTEAKRLLSYSTLNVKQISFDLGFNDLSYFQRFFKKRTGQTPREFRLEHSSLEVYI